MGDNKFIALKMLLRMQKLLVNYCLSYDRCSHLEYKSRRFDGLTAS